ncbi:hypothetical protein PV326_012764 [Microctonus aethiopoides]|nr:hypothetical protein PV326_012764 [Microctonus aethiopoides]
MSRVRRLSIRGIRNFSDETEETIRFTRPLTLIVGQNGVGKTTIIECLRYASTGEFPPGSEKGKSFIHDPMLKRSHAVHVRGNVRAEFLDKQENSVTVTRIIEATRSEAGLKFKTVDSTLTRTDKTTKEEFSITHRCTDVNKEIKEILGLSTAILNNVIFCHQDDANWPLEESRKLKERLDEIFDTTRYNKALEQLRSLIRVKQSEVRLMNVEKKGLAVLVEEVKAKEIRYNDYKERKLESTEKIERLLDKLRPVQERISELKCLEDKFFKLKVEQEKKEIELSLAKQQLKVAESSLKKIFNGTDAELLTEIQSYDDMLIEKNKRIADIEKKLKELSKIETQIASTLSEHRELIGTLRQQMADQDKRINNRNHLLNEILENFGDEPIESNANEEEIKSKIDSIEMNMALMEDSLETMRCEHDDHETLLEKQLEVLRDKRTKIDFELKQTEKEVNETRETLRDSRAQIARQGDAEKKLNIVDANLENIKQQIKIISDTIATECIQEKIDIATQQLNNLDEEYINIDKLLTTMQNQSTLNAKMDTFKSELKVKYREIEELKEKHGDTIEQLLGTNKFSGIDLQNAVEKVQITMNERLNKLRQEINSEQYKAMSIETSIEHDKQQLNMKMSEIQCDKEKILIHCKDYNNYSDTVLMSSNKIKGLQNKIGMFAYQGTAYGEYVKILSGPKSCCPLCERNFEKPVEATNLITKINNDLKQHPERLKQYQNELNTLQERHDALLSLKTIVESVVLFEEVGKAKMSRKIKENQQKLEKSQKKIKELEDLMVEPEKKIGMCNNLSGDLALWSRNLTDIERIEGFFSEIQSQSSQFDISTDKTIDEIKNDRELLQQKIKDQRDKINNLRIKMDTQNNELRQCNEMRSKCLEEQLKAHNDLQKVKHLRENINTLLKREQILVNTMQEWRQKLIPAQDELDAAERSLEEVKNKYREQQDKERKKVVGYSKKIEKLNLIQIDVVNFYARKIKDRLTTIEKDMNDKEKLMEDNKCEKMKNESELIELKENISCQEMNKRNLTDNYELRQKRSTVDKISAGHRIMQLEIEDLNYEEAKREMELLEKKCQELERAMNVAKGSNAELDYNIKQLEDELEKEEYRTAREKYQEKWLEQAITEDAICDLQAYSKALDLSLSDYHEERMNTVNETMKNLWNLIYTGSDTTSIQIRTEATTGTGARRQFNYKLVQIKHGVEMDMKGRCSAGQRVLASIVIRLALAETFCEQCGMLALDEPTTNLDAGNAANLAQALYDYVSLRSNYQKSFQLIIITHDENFIHKLSDLNSTKSFYELYRNVEGLTSIRYLTHDAEPNKRRNDNNRHNNGEDKSQDSQIVPRKETQQKRGASPSASVSRSKKPYDFDL